MNAQADFSRLSDFLPDQSATTQPAAPLFDESALTSMTKKFLSANAADLMLAALDAGASPDALRHLAPFLRTGALTAALPGHSNRTLLSALVDNFDPARAAALQTIINYQKDLTGLRATGVTLLNENPAHQALVWMFRDLVAAAVQERDTINQSRQYSFWSDGAGGLSRSLLKALDDLAATDRSSFVTAVTNIADGLRVLDGIEDRKTRRDQHDPARFANFPVMNALDSVLRAECPQALTAILRSPFPTLFMSSTFNSDYGQADAAFGLADPSRIWPTSVFRFLFRHLASASAEDAAVFEESARHCIALRNRLYHTAPGASRQSNLCVPDEVLKGVWHRKLSEDERADRNLASFRFKPSGFTDLAILTNINLVESLLSSPESAKAVFEVWDRHPHGPTALFSTFRPSAAAAFFMAHKDVLSLWRAPGKNGSNILHHVIAAMSPFEACRQAVLAVLEAAPELAEERNTAGFFPADAIRDPAITAAINQRLLKHIVPDVAKESGKRTSKAAQPRRL